jgi:diguanylate cyclase
MPKGTDMVKSRPILQKRKPVFFAVVIAIILFSICVSFILILHNNLKQGEILEATDRFITFESKVERLIYSNVTLLQGYEAYIKSNPELNEEDTYLYLDNLLSNHSEYIRNIGIIQDTTITWNYPRASNSAAIGVDLSKIEKQRDLVLKVKTELKPVLQGPVALVQGGSGFIVRLPVVSDDTGYWGQISIVLDSDKLLKEISSYAESSELNIAIFNQQNDESPFWGDSSFKGNSTLTFNVDPAFINWKAYVDLPHRWSNNYLIFVLAIFFSAGVSAFVGFLVYQYLKANNKIMDMSIHDSLTGLYNRHFLEEYQSIVLSAAKRENQKAAFMLLDLDHFKKINDTYGHGVGDLVLAETSRILKESTRKHEAAFRLGGDEFLLILPVIESIEFLRIIKEKLKKRFEQELCIADYHIKTTLSIGCAMFPEDGEDIDTLLHMADRQMYLEKSRLGEKSIN